MVFKLEEVRREYYGPAIEGYNGGPHKLSYTHIPSGLREEESLLCSNFPRGILYRTDRELLARLKTRIEALP